MRALKAFTAIILFGLILAGCSGYAGDPVATPMSGDTRNGEYGSSNRTVWGYYDIVIDPDAGTIEAVPMRGVEYRCNMTHVMELTGPTHLKFANFDLSEYFSTGRLRVDIGLEHPFPGLDQFTGFDVWGVFMSNGSQSLTYEGLNYPKEQMDSILLNADGYTRWFNKPEFTAPFIAGYTPGAAGTPGFEPDALLNGYKIFADGLGAEDDPAGFLADDLNFNNRMLFSPGSTNWRRYDIRFEFEGVPVLKFQYAIHASWVLPEPSPPMDIPEDFPLDANIQEANLLTCEVEPTLWFENVSTWGGDLVLNIDVYDWQGAYENPAGIPVEIGDVKVAGNFIPSTWTGGYSVTGGDAHYSTVQVDVPESMLNLTHSDGNECFVIVESADPVDYSDDGLIPQGNYPANATLAAFLRVPVPVSTGNLPPNVGDIQGPSAPCAGIPTMYTLDYATDPEGLPLTITWENDGDNDFADDEDGDDTNLSATLTFPLAGVYTIIVRISDGVNVVDKSISVTAKNCDGLNLTDVTPPGWPVVAKDVWSDGIYAYVVGPYGGLSVFQIGDAGKPFYIGGYSLPGEGNEVQVIGNYCVVADGSAGMAVLDVTDPANPVLVGSYVGTSAEGVFVTSDGFCYLADGKGNLKILDVGGGSMGGSPENPVLEAEFPVDYSAIDVYVSEGLAFLCDLETSLKILDVGGGTAGGSPSNPQLESELSLISDPIEVVSLGDYVYVSNGQSTDGGFVAVNITQPWLPFITQTNSLMNQVNDLWIDSGYLYLVDGLDLQIWSISTPESPSFAGSTETPGHASGVMAYGQFAYVADYYDGLEVYDVYNPQEPILIGQYFTPHDPYDIDIEYGYVWLADDGSGMEVVDVGVGASPEEPLMISRWDVPKDARGIYIEGDYAYIGGGWIPDGDLYIANIADPYNPFQVGYLASDYTYGVQKVGEYLYAVSYESGLKIYDVDGGAMGGSPSNPKYVTSFDTMCTWGLHALDGYVYLADGHNLGSAFYVIDVGGGTGSPTSPVLADNFVTTPEHLYDVQVVDGYAYCSAGDAGTGNGLRIFDVGAATGAPDDIQFVSQYDTAQMARGLCVQGGYAFVVCCDGEMVAIDVGAGFYGGTVENPQLADQITLPGDCFDVMADGQYAYVVSHQGGLRVVRLWD